MTRLARARTLMARPEAWLDVQGAGYALRLGGDRRARVILTLDEATFRALAGTPGLRARPTGGWMARGPGTTETASPAGRPGLVEGRRLLMAADGHMEPKRANLGQSALTYLANRRDPEGRPILTAREVAAGERLRLDREMAESGPSLTMRWDALPRASGASAARIEPTDRALAAGRRADLALKACGPWRTIVEVVCVQGSALQAAERQLGLRRRTGRAALRAGLQALADHYRIG